MNSDVENPSASPTGTRFCSRCNRLMADETGDLCDHCEPPPPLPANQQTPHEPFAAITWTLIAINVPASILASVFAHQGVPFGAALGPSVIAGEWWLLLTALFVHSTLGHLLWNLIGLWFFGKRLERILGKWAFLGLYLISGMIGNLVMLWWFPEDSVNGASSGIFGIVGAVAAIYVCRFRTLTLRQWMKLGLVISFTSSALYLERYDAGTAHLAHLGGLISGMALGPALAFIPAHRRALRQSVVTGAITVLIAIAISARLRDAYVVHLHLALSALDAGNNDAAARELQLARSLKQDSPLADYVAWELEKRDAVHLHKASGN